MDGGAIARNKERERGLLCVFAQHCASFETAEWIRSRWRERSPSIVDRKREKRGGEIKTLTREVRGEEEAGRGEEGKEEGGEERHE